MGGKEKLNALVTDKKACQEVELLHMVEIIIGLIKITTTNQTETIEVEAIVIPCADRTGQIGFHKIQR